MHAFGYLDC